MKEIRFGVRQTGYDQCDTNFLVTRKDTGTDPNFKVYQDGAYDGELTLSERGVRELINALGYLLSDG